MAESHGTMLEMCILASPTRTSVSDSGMGPEHWSLSPQITLLPTPEDHCQDLGPQLKTTCDFLPLREAGRALVQQDAPATSIARQPALLPTHPHSTQTPSKCLTRGLSLPLSPSLLLHLPASLCLSHPYLPHLSCLSLSLISPVQLSLLSLWL